MNSVQWAVEKHSALRLLMMGTKSESMTAALMVNLVHHPCIKLHRQIQNISQVVMLSELLQWRQDRLHNFYQGCVFCKHTIIRNSYEASIRSLSSETSCNNLSLSTAFLKSWYIPNNECLTDANILCQDFDSQLLMYSCMSEICHKHKYSVYNKTT